MKKAIVLIAAGFGAGFVFGSRAGRDPYERLEEKLREISNRPEFEETLNAAEEKVADAIDKVVNAATDRAEDAADTAKAKVG